MSRSLLDQLDEWKTRFDSADTAALERLLSELKTRRFDDPRRLIRLHETLLFLRAWPRTPRVAELADAILFSFADRVVGLDPAAFEEPEYRASRVRRSPPCSATRWRAASRPVIRATSRSLGSLRRNRQTRPRAPPLAPFAE